MSRYEILDREQMNTQQREVADTIASGPRGALKGPFLALIHNPALAGKVQALGEHLRYGTGIAQQLVEIAILVTARRWSCDYEWAAHARIAREAGLRLEIIEPISRKEKPEGMNSQESSLYTFAYETVWNGEPSEATFDALITEFGKPASLDVLAVCGYYTMLAFVLNTASLPLPPQASPLPPLHSAS